ncbi:MAG: glutaredoxin family protein [Lautropia sp.]|nr:glutaredoxin family protein [Lautropia sp.]
MKLSLLSRRYCSLCQKMLAELRPWCEAHGVAVVVIDVDEDPALVARYNDLVPVLLAGEQEICHWHLDKPALQDWLRNRRMA